MARKAFPSAYGFGTGSNGTTQNIGGAGGALLFIDNLNDAGPGSFREAWEGSGPRCVIPRLKDSGPGIVDLQSNVKCTNPYMSYWGHLAPGGGLIVRNYNVEIVNTHDIIVRHLRSYTGHGGPAGQVQTQSILIWGTGGPCYNITLDHCTTLWSNDQNLNVTGEYYDITIQWCLTAEGVITWNDTTVRDHSFPTFFGPDLIRTPFTQHTMSLHHNAWITGDGRMPLLFPKGPGTQTRVTRYDMRNCLSYNWKGNNFSEFYRSFYTENNYNTWIAANSVEDVMSEINVVKCQSIKSSRGAADNAFAWHTPQVSLYLSQNLGPLSPSTPADGFAIGLNRFNFNWDGHSPSPATHSHGTYSTTPYDNIIPFDAPAIIETDAVDLFAELTVNCGATLPTVDSALQRIQDYTIADTGPDTADFDLTEGYPTLAFGTYPTDTSGDGMPDAWKIANGLDPLVDDRLTPQPGTEYFWIEVYANEVAGDTTPSGSNAPVNTVPATQNIAKNIVEPVAMSVQDDDSNITSIVLNCDEGSLSVTLSPGVTPS